jgi:hypothetical protein
MKYLFFFILLLNFCSSETHPDNDPNFTLGENEIWYYKDKLYTGYQVAEYPNGVKRQSEFKEGLQDGLTFDVHPSGQIMAEYPYKAGKKVGVHKGWYDDGKPRFWFEYKDGLNHGEHWEWLPTGKIYRYGRYDNDRIIGEKVWRKDGLIYSNYIYTPKKLYGVVGSKLCFTVKGDDTKKKTESF